MGIQFTVQMICDKCGKSIDSTMQLVPIAGPDYQFNLIQDVPYWRIDRMSNTLHKTYCPECASKMYF